MNTLCLKVKAPKLLRQPEANTPAGLQMQKVFKYFLLQSSCGGSVNISQHLLTHINIYAAEVPFDSNVSSSRSSHVGSLLSKEEQKKVGSLRSRHCATHGGFVLDVTDKNCQIKKKKKMSALRTMFSRLSHGSFFPFFFN